MEWVLWEWVWIRWGFGIEVLETAPRVGGKLLVMGEGGGKLLVSGGGEGGLERVGGRRL